MKGNIKAVIVCLLAILCLGFMSEKADAFSLKVRGGTGVSGNALRDATTSSSTYTGISMFFYEGKTWDFFLGYDQVKQEATMKNLPITSEIKFSGSGSTANLGLHYKFSTEWWVKPYLSFEALYPISASSEYTIKSSDPSRITLRDSEGAPPFGGRGGIGIEREITEKLSIGLEFSTAVYPFNYKWMSQDQGTSSKNVYTDPALQVDINLGLRYFF
ncbi:MAG: hypothetical protein HZA00_00850 [Nitrospinae bacterium]|nr:hypothetical protein [Nitrospinota bacterium]